MIVLRLGPKLFSFIANLHNYWSKQVSPASVLSRVVAQLLLQLWSLFYIEDNEQDYCCPTYNSVAPRHQLEAGDACASGGEQSSREPPLFSCSGKVATGAKLGHNRSCRPISTP